MTFRVFRYCALFALLAMASLAARRAAAQEAAPEPSGYEQSFLELHAHLGEHYPFFKQQGIDWNAVKDQFLPRVRAAKTDDEFGLLMRELLAALRDSNAQLVTVALEPVRPELPRYSPGVTCLLDASGALLVYHVSAPDAGGCKPGMQVIAVNGVPAAEALAAAKAVHAKYRGFSSDRQLNYFAARRILWQTQENAGVKLDLRTADGTESTITLPANQTKDYAPMLPAPIAGIDENKEMTWKKLDDKTGYIYLRRVTGNLSARMTQALQELAGVNHLILDLRGSSGSHYQRGTSHAHFEDAGIAKQQKQPAPESEEAAKPADVPRFAGHVAVLIDNRSAGAAEGWLSWFKGKPKSRLFGETTGGCWGRVGKHPLLNGYYEARFTDKEFLGSTEKGFYTTGIEPDAPCAPTAADLAAGRDTVLEAAKAWLSTQGK